jgi:hypothetical protein
MARAESELRPRGIASGPVASGDLKPLGLRADPPKHTISKLMATSTDSEMAVFVGIARVELLLARHTDSGNRCNLSRQRHRLTAFQLHETAKSEPHRASPPRFLESKHEECSVKASAAAGVDNCLTSADTAKSFKLASKTSLQTGPSLEASSSPMNTSS